MWCSAVLLFCFRVVSRCVRRIEQTVSGTEDAEFRPAVQGVADFLLFFRQFFDELLQSAHGDFSYIKKTLINLVVLTYRFAESYINSSENEYDAIEHLFRCESMETLSKESLSLLESLIQTGSSSFGDGIAERITDYLEQNLEQNVSLDMLAHLIKKNTGQSFSELLLDLRLKKSMELLRLTDMRINDIAAKAGYNDVSYFISIFKKCTGVTPKEWRSLAKLGEL